MSNKNKNLIIIIIVIVLGFLGFLYMKGGDEKDVSLLQKADVPTTDALLQDIRSAISRIASIELDTSIFSNQILMNLEDHSRPINNEPIGRPNPFEMLLSGSSLNMDAGTSTSSTDDNGSAEVN